MDPISEVKNLVGGIVRRIETLEHQMETLPKRIELNIEIDLCQKGIEVLKTQIEGLQAELAKLE